MNEHTHISIFPDTQGIKYDRETRTGDPWLSWTMFILVLWAPALIAVSVHGATQTPEPSDTVGSIRLRPHATVTGPEITLGDIGDLEGQPARRWADTVVGTLTPSPDHEPTTVTLATVRQTLDALSAPWGTLTLGGYPACKVSVLGIEHDQTSNPSNPGSDHETPSAGSLKNQHDDANHPRSQWTLRDQLRVWLQDWAGQGDEQDLTITFHDRDAQALDTPVGRARFAIQPMTRGPLGRVPIKIHRYEQDQLIETYRVNVDITRRVTAVVAQRTIRRGAKIEAGDVQLHEVEIDNNLSDPVQGLDAAIGQRASSVIRVGTTVCQRHLESPLLVRRGDLITVEFVGGGLVVKTVARSNENGSLGQHIQVRSERTRQPYTVRVVGLKRGRIITDPGTALGTAPAPDSGLAQR